MTEAREWAATAEQRPGRSEILNRITQEQRDSLARRPHPRTRLRPGLPAQRLLQRLPGCFLHGIGLLSAMHELARARLEPWSAQATFLERSFKSESWTEGLEPFQLVVTNQAVHELRHKRHAPGLHRQVLDVLAQRAAICCPTTSTIRAAWRTRVVHDARRADDRAPGRGLRIGRTPCRRRHPGIAPRTQGIAVDGSHGLTP